MIVSYDNLSQFEKKVILVDGCFDPLHLGHIKYFEEAAKEGIPVLCNVQADSYILSAKERPNLLPDNQRIQVIDALKSISYVHLCTTSTGDVLSQLKPLKYVKGLDWKKRTLPPEETKVCQENEIEIVYLDTNIDSSTNIVANFQNAKQNGAHAFGNFEKVLFEQKLVESQHYDDEYFTGDWREGDNNYTIEMRRKIEARNPQNIKEVFQPKTVLDVGCGPGALMYFLDELGLECYGIDFSKAARSMAPKEVRDNIVVGSVCEYHEFGKKFELVICREVMEHLTIFQVRQTVKAIAQYSSKYVYVTTRYYPNPTHLLDITTDFETDPTHITLLNKDFLKLLFMLEGLRPRPDLEAAMDWKNVGRVLVFEKVNI